MDSEDVTVTPASLDELLKEWEYVCKLAQMHERTLLGRGSFQAVEKISNDRGAIILKLIAVVRKQRNALEKIADHDGRFHMPDGPDFTEEEWAIDKVFAIVAAEALAEAERILKG